MSKDGSRSVFRAKKDTAYHYRKGSIPVRHFNFDNSANGTPNTGIIEHTIEPTELGHCTVNQDLDLALLTHITTLEPDPIPISGLAAQLERFCAGLFVKVCHNDTGPGLQKP